MPDKSSAESASGAEHFFAVAHAFCSLIDKRNVATQVWLRDVSNALIQLKNSIEQITPIAFQIDDKDDTAERFAMFAEIKEWLGELDDYWMAGDKSTDAPSLTGSLADDLTDIYFDIRNAFSQAEEFEGDLELHAGSMRERYELHWEEHLNDALRYLSILKMCQRI